MVSFNVEVRVMKDVVFDITLLISKIFAWLKAAVLLV